MVRLVVLGVLVAIAGLCWASWHFLGAWTFLVVPVVLWVVGKVVGGWIAKQLFLIPFKAKGEALLGATATIHSVAACAPPPKGDDGSPEDEEDRRDWKWHRLEATIRQPEAGGIFRMWEPGSLELVRPDYDPAADDRLKVTDVHDVEIEQDGKFVPNEGMKFEGPRKVRMTFRIRPGTGPLVFHYYFQKFGRVSVP